MSRRLLFFLLVLGLCAAAQGAALVYLHIDRVKLAYELKRLESARESREVFLSKLLVERDNLASPTRLKKKATEFGLGPAKAGQIRRVEDGTE